MTPFYWALLAISLGGFAIALYTWFTSRTVDTFAASTQSRLNGAMDKLTRVEERVSNGLTADVARHEKELFRQGEYPDLGLREWCRVWRGKLRGSIQSLSGRVSHLEARVETPAVWTDQNEILSRLKRLEEVQAATLKHLNVVPINEYVETKPEPEYVEELHLISTIIPPLRKKHG